MAAMDVTIHSSFTPQDHPEVSLVFLHDTLGFIPRVYAASWRIGAMHRAAVLLAMFAGAALLRLQHEAHTGMVYSGAHTLGFVADDYVDIPHIHGAGGGRDHVGQQRIAANLMQHLGPRGFQPRAFTGRHDGDGEPSGGLDSLIGHELTILEQAGAQVGRLR